MLINAATWVLDLLFLSWFFWPVIAFFPVICYFVVIDGFKDSEWRTAPAILLSIVALAVVWRFDSLKPYAKDWHWWAIAFGTYMGAGFCMTLYKWMRVIIAFRKQDIKSSIQRVRENVDKTQHMNHEPARNNEVVRELKMMFPKTVVTCDSSDRSITIWPDRNAYSLSLWWCYWPFFLLEIPFELVGDLVTGLLRFLRGFYNGLAKSFSVKG